MAVQFLLENSSQFPFQRSLTAKFKYIFNILVIGETDSPAVSGLRYFSTLDIKILNS